LDLGGKALSLVKSYDFEARTEEGKVKELQNIKGLDGRDSRPGNESGLQSSQVDRGTMRRFGLGNERTNIGLEMELELESVHRNGWIPGSCNGPERADKHVAQHANDVMKS
jgi:hypothetical protein